MARDAQAPLALHLPVAALRHKIPMRKLIARQVRAARADLTRLLSAFAFCNDEERFARRLLRCKPNVWLFRTHQQRFCGDFVVVDMSSPAPASRPVCVLDLKLGAPLKVGGGGAGVQFQNAALAVREIASTHGVLSPDASPRLLCGDRRALLAHLGCPARA